MDRAVSSGTWADLFPSYGVSNEPFNKSDHRPILIDTDFQQGLQPRGPTGPRKFEARWLAEEEVEVIVQTAWDRAKSSGVVPYSQVTDDIHAALHTWDKETFKGPRTRLRKLQKELNTVMMGHLTDDAVARQHELHLQIENLLEQEKIYWMQRGRADWLFRGDQNTEFFHRAATGRRKKNFIKKLKGELGDWIEQEDLLKGHVASYFEGLFSSEVHDPDQAVLDKVKPRVSPEMNDELMKPYTRE